MDKYWNNYTKWKKPDQEKVHCTDVKVQEKED